MKITSLENKKLFITNPDWRNPQYVNLTNNAICGVRYKLKDHDEMCNKEKHDDCHHAYFGHIQYYSIDKNGKGSFNCFSDECHGICPDFDKLDIKEIALLITRR